MISVTNLIVSICLVPTTDTIVSPSQPLLRKDTAMSIYFSTNIPELKSMASFKTAENQIAKSSYRLATGQRVNSGADDAAGFKVREGLRADIKNIAAQSANITKADNVLNIAQSSISQALQVLRGDPDDDSNNGIVGFLASLDGKSDADIAAAAADFKDLGAALQSTLGAASYDGVQMFSADNAVNFNITVGKAVADGTAQKVAVDTKLNASIKAADFTALTETALTDGASLTAAAKAASDAIGALTTESGRLGNKQNVVSYANNSFSAQSTMLKEADGRISSVDSAVESSNLAKAELLAQNSMNVMQYSRSFASFVATSAFG